MKIISSVVAAVAVSVGLAAHAQPYPNRTIRMVVPYTAGGGVDVVARHVAAELSQRLGQTIVVENKVGAGSNIGSDSVAKAAADGYTLLMASPANAINMSLYRRMPYDTRRDLAPVALVGAVPSVLTVNPSFPARSIAEFVAAAKAKPGSVNYGSGGNGTSEHLAAEMFKAMAGIDMVHVPYKGGAAAMTDVIGGQIQAMFSNQLGAMPHIKGGKLRVLGVADSQRSAALPDTPTFAESGYPEFLVTVWWGVMAPAGTPRDVIERLNKEINAAVSAPELKKKLEDMGARVSGGSPEQFAAFVNDEIARWARAVKDSGAVQD
jgi:tripartite-type tricarboxylate transporter receptor subunit TctC